MQYSVFHISILIDLLLVTENVDLEEKLNRNRDGLIKLQKEVEFEVEKELDRSEKQYLYKLNKRIGEAIQLEEESIVVKEVFIQQCVNYLNYDSFKDFEGRLSFIQKQLEEKTQSETKIRFLFPEERKNRIAGDVEAAQKQDQYLEFIQEEYNTKDISWKKIVTKQASEEILVWFIPASMFQENTTYLQQFFSANKGKLAQVLPFFLTSKPKELEALKASLQEENLMGFDGDLEILVQLLIYFQNQKKSEDDKKNQHTPNNLIKDNTNVVLGDVKIKSRYFNNGDMYINETK